MYDSTTGTLSVALKVLAGLILAAIVGLAGWAYATGNRMTAVEAALKSQEKFDAQMHEDLKEIKQDLRQVREILLEERRR
jgi:hypothetical protein